MKNLHFICKAYTDHQKISTGKFKLSVKIKLIVHLHKQIISILKGFNQINIIYIVTIPFLYEWVSIKNTFYITSSYMYIINSWK